MKIVTLKDDHRCILKISADHRGKLVVDECVIAPRGTRLEFIGENHGSATLRDFDGRYYASQVGRYEFNLALMELPKKIFPVTRWEDMELTRFKKEIE